jgi:uncharacterized ubiquitin-like protein YukD
MANVEVGKPYRGQVVLKIENETTNCDNGKVKVRRLIHLDNEIILIEDTYHDYGDVYVNGKHLPYNEIEFPQIDNSGYKPNDDDEETKQKKKDLIRQQAKDILHKRKSNSASPDTTTEPNPKDNNNNDNNNDNDDDDDDFITVTIKTPDGKKLPIKIDPDDTIEDLKEKIEDDHGIPVAEQNLSLNGKPLNDPNATLNECGIKPGATIDWLPVNIIVSIQTPDGKVLPVMVKPNDTVQDLKRKVEKDHGIPVADQYLAFQGKPLDDPSSTLVDCGLKDGDRIDLLPPQEMTIIIETPDGKKLPVSVKPNLTVRDLKKKVEAEHGIPSEDQNIRHHDKRLDDPGATLQSYGVNDGDVLTMEPYDTTITVRVRTPDGKKLRVKVEPTDSVQDLKNNIEKEHHIPIEEQDLSFNDQQLDDPKAMLSDYGIKHHGDIIDLNPINLKGIDLNNADDMIVIVKTPEGKELSIPVKPDDSIRQLQKIIKTKHGVPVKDQSLSWKGFPLDDPDMTLSDYGLSDGDIINLDPTNQEHITIIVQSPDGDEYPIEIKRNGTVKDVKNKLHDVHDVPVKDQMLSLRGKPLDDPNATLADCGIRDGDIVDLLGDGMQITIKTTGGKCIPVSVAPGDTVQDLKQKLREEHGIPVPVADQSLSLNGKPMDDPRATMDDIGLKNGDTVDFKVVKASKQPSTTKDTNTKGPKTRVRTLGPNSAWVFPSKASAPKKGEKKNLQGVWSALPGKEAGQEPVEVLTHPKNKEPVSDGKTVHGVYGYINGAKPDADGVVDPANVVFYPPEEKPSSPDFEMVGYWSSPNSSKETSVSYRFEGADMIHLKKVKVSFMGTEMTFTSEYTK